MIVCRFGHPWGRRGAGFSAGLRVKFRGLRAAILPFARSAADALFALVEHGIGAGAEIDVENDAAGDDVEGVGFDGDAADGDDGVTGSWAEFMRRGLRGAMAIWERRREHPGGRTFWWSRRGWLGR